MMRSVCSFWAAPIILCLTIGMHAQQAAPQNPVPPAPAPQAPAAQAPAPQPPAPQQPAPQEMAPPVSEDRLSFGIRARVMPLRDVSVLGNKHTITTTTDGKTLYDWSYNTTSRSPIYGGGVEFEVRFTRRNSLSLGLMYQRITYDKVTDTWWGGTVDPTTNTDTRLHTTTAEHTTGRFWDLPLILRHQGIRSSGALSHLILDAGVTGRTVSTIRTTNTITNTDSTKTVNNFETQPGRRTVIGGVIGFGFRTIDDFRIKTTPEIRYTRWVESTFSSTSTMSSKNQLEIGISFTR